MKTFKCTLTLLTFLVMVGLASTHTYAAGANEVESQIKATYLYKFANYVEWPAATFPESNTPFIIGVVGSEDIAANLKGLIEKEGILINNRNVQVVILKPSASLSNVQILFIGKADNAMIKAMLNPIQTRPVLTITESEAGLDDGSIINFANDDDHVRFSVSVIQAERSGLKISARLLKVAKKVETSK